MKHTSIHAPNAYCQWDRGNPSRRTLHRLAWLLCIWAALAACKEKTEIVEMVRAIKTTTVSEQAAEQVLKFSGIVAAVDSSDLSFEVGGQVADVYVDIGDTVEKGQTLAVLDPEPYQLDVDAAKAELIKARDNVTKSRSQYERHKRIFEEGAGAKSWLDVVEYNYKAARSAVSYQVAKLDLAQRNLRKTELNAPYHGTIAWRSVQPQEEVRAGQKIFEINASGEKEVQLAVPETNIDQIGIDTPAKVTFPTMPGQSTNGRVSYIGSAAVEANAFPVKVALIDPSERVKPGMTAEAGLLVTHDEERPGYLVPIQALLPAPEANRGYAFVFDPDTSTVKKTTVNFHGTEHKMVIVDEGLSAWDIIAVAGVGFLADGMEVKLLKD